MATGSKIPAITMELYETDVLELEKFIQNETEKHFTKNYLILYDFAVDCKYSKHIQKELFHVLLPYYLNVIEQAVLYGNYGNKIAVDIYFQFNIALFFNRIIIKKAIGEEAFKEIMEFYVKQVIACMGREEKNTMEWIPLFNTTIALENENICKLLERILAGEINIKYAFFKYLSILIFRDSDNLLIENQKKDYWSSDIWTFDDGYFGRIFYWSHEAVTYFDKIITSDLIQKLFHEVKPKISDEFGIEFVELLREEIEISIANQTFCKRKSQYLEKIACKTGETTYWQ